MIHIILAKAVRPILFVSHQFNLICIKFKDGDEISQKDEAGLRMFLATHQHMTFERIHGYTSHCVESELGYYTLLGFRFGEAVHCRGLGISLPILFSKTRSSCPFADRRSDI